jgi:hypothetical protein
VDASGSVRADAAARSAVTIDTIDRSKRGFKPPSIEDRDDLRGWAICGRGHEHPRVWDDS